MGLAEATAEATAEGAEGADTTQHPQRGDGDDGGDSGDGVAGWMVSGLDQVSCGVGLAPNALVVITGLAVVHFIWITFLGIAQLSQIFADITTYEAIRGKEAKTVTCKHGWATVYAVLRGRPTGRSADEGGLAGSLAGSLAPSVGS